MTSLDVPVGAFVVAVLIAIAGGALAGAYRVRRRPSHGRSGPRRVAIPGRAEADAGAAGDAAPPVAPARPLDWRAEALRRKSLISGLLIEYRDAREAMPTRFPELLDEAEPYINQRLAERGERWLLDEAVRKALGLPPRGR